MRAQHCWVIAVFAVAIEIRATSKETRAGSLDGILCETRLDVFIPSASISMVSAVRVRLALVSMLGLIKLALDHLVDTSSFRN